MTEQLPAPYHANRQSVLTGRLRAERDLAAVCARIATSAKNTGTAASRGVALPHGPGNIVQVASLLAEASRHMGAIAAYDNLMAAYADAGNPIHHPRLRKAGAPDEPVFFWVCACGEQADGNVSEAEAHLHAALHSAHAEGLPLPVAHNVQFQALDAESGRTRTTCSCGDFASAPGTADWTARRWHEHAAAAAASWWAVVAA